MDDASATLTQLPPLPTAAELCAVELLAHTISPAAAAVVGRMHVSHMVFAARAEPRAPMASFSVSAVSAVKHACASLHAVMTRQAAELRQAAVALRARDTWDAPAWQLGQRVPAHAEAALHSMQLYAQAITATLQDSLSPTRGYVALLGRPMSAPERGNIADVTNMMGQLHVFLASSQSLLAQLRCRRGAAITYLEVSAGVLDLGAAITGAVQHGNQQRLAEFGPRVAADVVWPTSYHEHAATVGCSF